jgi:hypothetical protein
MGLLAGGMRACHKMGAMLCILEKREIKFFLKVDYQKLKKLREKI